MFLAVLSILSVFLQVLTPVINLPAIVIIFAAGYKNNAAGVYVLAFGTGLLADLVSGNQLGILAGAYLLAALAVSLFKTKYSFNIWFLAGFTAIFQLIFFYARAFIR